jgi:hypothetical protein
MAAMAPTSDERIEIAERMRGPFDVCECMGHTFINGTLYGMQVCAKDELALRDGMRHLANLIDPTCEMDDAGDVPASVKDNLNTCPNCGARVVSE